MIEFEKLSIEEALQYTLVMSVVREAEKLAPQVAPRLGFSQPPAARSAPRSQLTFASRELDNLRECLLAHVEVLGLLDLAAPSMCDVYLNTVAREFLQEAESAGVGQAADEPVHWITAIGDVCMVLLADENRLQAVGAQHLVELAHEAAVREAAAQGKPHNAQALSIYQARELSGQDETHA